MYIFKNIDHNIENYGLSDSEENLKILFNVINNNNNNNDIKINYLKVYDYSDNFLYSVTFYNDTIIKNIG